VILFSQDIFNCENVVFNAFQNPVLYTVYGEIISSKTLRENFGGRFSQVISTNRM